jgi:hypothetical protein
MLTTDTGKTHAGKGPLMAVTGQAAGQAAAERTRPVAGPAAPGADRGKKPAASAVRDSPAASAGGSLQQRHALLETLRRKIRHLETAGRPDSDRVISTTCPELDALLPGGGLASGAIHEWLAAAPGCGAEVLSLLAARSACAEGGALVVIDPHRQFYPPAAAAWGIALENTIVVRAGSGNLLLWAIDQALRCTAVAAVWGRLEWISERWQRRFQLSAEAGGATGFLVRPAQARRYPGWAEVQWLVEGSANPGSTRFDREMAVRLVRARGGPALVHPPVRVQIDFTSGSLRAVASRRDAPCADSSRIASLAATLAHPPRRPAAARQRRA